MKKKFELLPGLDTVILETVFNIPTVLPNVFLAGEQSSILISDTNLAHQELFNLVWWSDNILLRLTTKVTTHSTQDSQETPVKL